MIYKLFKSFQFKRNIKKRKLTDAEEMAYIDVVYKLLNDIKLDEKYRNHGLKGDKNHFQECHIKPDLLLIYQINNGVVKLFDIGSHSELFK
jgi:mRNA interferase YafQ